MYGALQAKPFIYTYVQDTVEIVHGPSCKRERELHLTRCSHDGIPLYERRTGGGTVVLGPGMVVTIVVGERGNVSATGCFNAIHDAMIMLLCNAGIRGIERSGISDLSFNNRKILGSSLYMGNSPRLFYYQSSLLVAHDPALFERYLLHPPREPGYRGQRTHTDFCTSLTAQGFSAETAAIADVFQQHLGDTLRLPS
jgi:lipoate-protein ligase A